MYIWFDGPPGCILMRTVLFTELQITVCITAAGFIYVGCLGLQMPISFLCLTKLHLHFKRFNCSVRKKILISWEVFTVFGCFTD